MSLGLKRDLGLTAVFCTATGAMISSGLFVLPGIAHAKAGPAVIVSYVLAGLLATTGMLSQAELVSAMPKAGGTYFFVMRSMGPAVGTVDGLITWLSLSLKTAFALVGLAAFSCMFVHIDPRLLAVGLCLVFTAANLLGIKGAGRLQIGLVIGLLAILLVYVIRGLPAVKVSNLEPFAPEGPMAVLSTAGFVFVSYGGLLKVAAISEEVRHPARTIPIGMALSLLTVGLFYTAVVFVTSGTVPAEILNTSMTPITEGARLIMGPKGAVLLSVAAVLAFVSTVNAGIMASSRYPLALARDGLLPERVSAVNARFGTPHVAILATSALIILAVLSPIEALVKTASAVLILSFMFSCLCVIVMRESRIQNYRPRFRSPLYPWIQIVGTIGCALLLAGMGAMALKLSLLLVAGGLFVYWFYGRIRTTREYALLHLVERLTRRDLTAHMLETELKEIIQERDHIVTDRFDQLVETCPILDIEHSLDTRTCFSQAVAALVADSSDDPAALTQRLLEREQDSSTAITPFVAIPHLELEGEGRFRMVVVRCSAGVHFSERSSDVKAVFVLAGSRNERNFHLKALAAIAQVAQGHDFEKRWLRARNPADLRDVIQLGARVRSAGS